MTGTWRVASRLARREVRRRPGRTALVTLLVAIPVAGMLIALVLLRAVPLEGEWAAELRMGRSDLLIEGGPVDAALLPAGSSVETARVEDRVVRTSDGDRSSLVATDIPMDGLADGIVRVDSGRAPQHPGEALLSPTAASDLHVGVGDELRLSRPDGVVLDVVGIGERGDSLDEDVLVLGAGTPWPWRGTAGTLTFVALPVGFSANPEAGGGFGEPLTALVYGWSESGETRGFSHGLSRVSDSVSAANSYLFVNVRPGLDLPPSVLVYGSSTLPKTLVMSWIYVIGAIVATVVGIVITAAFAVSGRRQVMTLGQLAASGASPGALRRMLVLQGTWTGVIGVASGTVLAWLVLLVGRGPLEHGIGWAVAPFGLGLLELIPVILIGVGAATIAALVPARRAARLSILACLAGRRPTAPASLLVAMAGFVAIVGGLGTVAFALSAAGRNTSGDERWGFVVAAGGVALLLGACAAIPLLIGRLDSLAGRLRGSLRVGVRSLARQRTRTGAVVAAVAVSAGLAVTASSLYLGDDAARGESYSWSSDTTGFVVVDPSTHEPVGAATSTTSMPTMDEAKAASEAARGDSVRLSTRQLDGPNDRVADPIPVDQAVVAEVGGYVPGSSAHAVDVLSAPDGGPIGFIAEPTPSSGDKRYGIDPVLATPEVRALYELTPAESALLDEHGALVLGPGAAGQEWNISFVGAVGSATALASDRQIPSATTTLFLTPQVAQDLGFTPVAADIVLKTPERLSDDTLDDLYSLNSELSQDATDAANDGPAPLTRIDIASNDAMQFQDLNAGRPGQAAVQGLLAALVLVISLLVIAVNLWLSAAEGRDEREMLAVIGASPRTLRRSSAVKAVLLVLLGAVIAVPLGFIPALVVTRSAPLFQPVVFPWTVALLIVVVVPAVTYAVTVLASSFAGLRHRNRDLLVRAD